MFLILYFWKSNLYSGFLIFAFWYLLLILYFKNPVFSTHFYLGMWLLAWLLSPPFDSPFSPPSLLYFLLPPSLLYPTLWISLCVPGFGEHLGNWLLAGSVSLLKRKEERGGKRKEEDKGFPPLSSWPSLSPCSSSLLCVTLWTSLRDPDCGEHTGKWLLASCTLPFWFPLFSSWSPLSPSSLFSSLWNSVNLSECSRLWRAHRELITG